MFSPGGRLVGFQGLEIRVEHHGEHAVALRIVGVVAGAVLVDVVDVQAEGIQLAVQEHLQTGRNFLHIVVMDRGGLILALIGGIVIAEPVGVLGERILPVGLEGGQGIGAVGRGGLHAGAVRVVVHAVFHGGALIVQVGLHQPAIGEAVPQVEAFQWLFQDEHQLGIAERLHAHAVEADFIFGGVLGVQLVQRVFTLASVIRPGDIFAAAPSV